MNKLFVPFLPPWVETGLQPAFYDKESGTVLQQTARMYDKVNQLIRNFNDLSKETKETVELYIESFSELKDYVEDYFENLDVQDEINNKLDAMAQDGTLQEIVDSYLEANVSWTFDTVAEMQSATNLIEGSYTKTLGYTSINDGGGAFYNITSSNLPDSIPLSDGLYANLIKGSTFDINNFDLYGISYISERHSNGTKYYIVEIPYTNKLGLRNELVQGFGDDTYGDGETVADFASRKNSPFAMNIGLWDTVNHTPYAPVVQEGVEQLPSYANSFQPIAIDEDGIIKVYANGTTASDIIADGGVYACTAYHELIHENVVVYDTSESAWNVTPYKRQVIAQLDNNDYVVFSCDGMDFEDNDVGMTYEQVCNVLMTRYDNIKTAYACDGGGSVSTVVNGTFINQPSDDSFTSEREVSSIWYIKPVNRIENMKDVYSRLSQLDKAVKKNKASSEYTQTIFGTHGIVVKNDSTTERINAIDGRFRVTNVTNNKDVLYIDLPPSHPNEFQIDGERVFSLFKIMKKPSDYSITDADNINFPSMLFADGSTLTNVPDPTIAHIVMTFPILSASNLLQIVIPYNTNTNYKIQYRYNASGTWRAWRLGQ